LKSLLSGRKVKAPETLVAGYSALKQFVD